MSQRLIYSQVNTDCWRCGIGKFKLLPGSNCKWQCDKCKHIGYIPVYS